MNRHTAAVSVAVLACLIGISGCANSGIESGNPTPPASDPTESVRRHADPATDCDTHPTPTQAPAQVVQQNPRWALDRIDQRQLPFDKRYLSQGQGEGVTVYVVDGLFDTTNAEFGGRASVGLDLGQPCVLEDGINHGMFVAAWSLVAEPGWPSRRRSSSSVPRTAARAASRPVSDR